MKILHTADWHLGTFRSPVKDGVNLRTEDTKRCLDELIRVANEEKPDYSLVSGDIFHVGRLWSDRIFYRQYGLFPAGGDQRACGSIKAGCCYERYSKP